MSSAGITMVATASAAALDDSTQPKEVIAILLVPTPQKNMAGLPVSFRENIQSIQNNVLLMRCQQRMRCVLRAVIRCGELDGHLNHGIIPFEYYLFGLPKSNDARSHVREYVKRWKYFFVVSMLVVASRRHRIYERGPRQVGGVPFPKMMFPCR